MRIETVEYKLYTFEELPEETQAKIIENNYDFNVTHDWWENVYSDAEEVGLKITEFDLDRGSYVKGDFVFSACEVAQNILNNHDPMCETHKTAAAFLEDWQPHFNTYMDETSDFYESQEIEETLIDLEDEFLKSLQEDYRIILQKEYDYLTSEEAIKEILKANEYEFTSDGKIF